MYKNTRAIRIMLISNFIPMEPINHLLPLVGEEEVWVGALAGGVAGTTRAWSIWQLRLKMCPKTFPPYVAIY